MIEGNSEDTVEIKLENDRINKHDYSSEDLEREDDRIVDPNSHGNLKF